MGEFDGGWGELIGELYAGMQSFMLGAGYGLFSNHLPAIIHNPGTWGGRGGSGGG